MTEFPSNSHVTSEKDIPAAPELEKAKVQKIVSGTVVQRKKPLGKRMRELFIGDDGRGVARYVLLEVMIPAAKDTISDAISQGVERMLFGEASSRRRSNASRSGGYTDYSRIAASARSTPPWKKPAVEQSLPRQTMSRQARTTHNFDEIVFENRAEAEAVLDRMTELLERYALVTVADLYDLAGIETAFTDEKWGWVSLDDMRVLRVRNGYLLTLPRPETIDS